VRLTLAEKGVPYRLVEVGRLRAGRAAAGIFDAHPFGRMPAFEHAPSSSTRSGAIERYVDEASTARPCSEEPRRAGTDEPGDQRARQLMPTARCLG